MSGPTRPLISYTMNHISLAQTSINNAAHRAATTLREGGVVLYPTDTLYGLAVDATNEHALERLLSLKGRDASKPFSLIVPDVTMLRTHAYITPLTADLARRHLPGALTILLETRLPFSSLVSKDGATAFRIPNHPFCLALARTFGKPYTATSANISGKETEATTDAILAQFGTLSSHIDCIVDAGPLKSSYASTIVDARGKLPIVLRQGPIIV